MTKTITMAERVRIVACNATVVRRDLVALVQRWSGFEMTTSASNRLARLVALNTKMTEIETDIATFFGDGGWSMDLQSRVTVDGDVVVLIQIKRRLPPAKPEQPFLFEILKDGKAIDSDRHTQKADTKGIIECLNGWLAMGVKLAQ